MLNDSTTLKTLLLLLTLSLSSNLLATTDLSADFLQIYNEQKDLTLAEQQRLKEYDVYFIPGILAETLIDSDPDSSIDVTIFTKDYFGTQLTFLNEKYNIPAKRIKTSSYDVTITRHNIREAVMAAKAKGRKVILISHSLGGLALIEEVILNPEIQNHIGGIVFLQSPFYGTPVADIVQKFPYVIEKIIKFILPYVNISDETIQFVGIEARENFMKQNQEAIRNFIKKVPSYTFAGFANGHKSIFTPLIDIMEFGCIKGYKDRCFTDKYFQGPYDKSDGLIPLKSTHLDNADFVTLEKADHGEIILRVPYEDFSKEHMTTTWLRLLLQKMK